MRTSVPRVRAAVFALVAAFGLTLPVLAANAPDASAAVRPVAGCGFTFGGILQQGAAGTLFVSVALRPDSFAQHCTVPVTFTASVTPQSAAASRYTNVVNNPLTATQTVTFVPGRRPPELTVGWGGFHCADPASPGIFAIASGSQRMGTAVPANSCTAAGTFHSNLFSNPVAVQSAVGISPTPNDQGYRTVDNLGNLYPKGNAAQIAPLAANNGDVVGMATAPTGTGAWVVASDGGVSSYGSAAFQGSLGNVHLNAPIVGMAATKNGGGYWLVGSDGGVFTFGNAHFFGSTGNLHLAAPVVGIAPTPDDGGYYLVASDGGVFTFGDAVFAGSLGNVLLNAPVVGIAANPHHGYWLVASDGGVFTFGGAPFKGSAGALHLNASISGMAATTSGNGYWLLGSDNGIFTYGDAGFFGSSPFMP
jgi:hypothetical protein